ncbi:MAG: DUF934 domain-containing protein [Methylosarcina sp.]
MKRFWIWLNESALPLLKNKFMQIVKDKKIIEDEWRYIADGEELSSGDISVSLARWKQEKQQLLSHDGKVGLRIGPGDRVSDLSTDLNSIQLIELYFPDFADGRLFSQAWLLRSRYQYQGEIRAIGHYLPDQAFYLSRVGVNAFVPEKPELLIKVLSYLNDFTVKYQGSIN